MDNIRNIKLWLDNDQELYNTLVTYARKSSKPTYSDFIIASGMAQSNTPDGYPWLSEEVTKSLIDLDWFVAEHAND